jgi:deoxyribodipyrimidine photolyase
LSIFIFRRDFRIKDNTALNAALNNSLNNSSHIYPIFIFTPEQIKYNSYKSNNSIQFIAEPGRYFAEPSHTLVLNVIGKKNVIDRNRNNITGD